MELTRKLILRENKQSREKSFFLLSKKTKSLFNIKEKGKNRRTKEKEEEGNSTPAIYLNYSSEKYIPNFNYFQI